MMRFLRYMEMVINIASALPVNMRAHVQWRYNHVICILWARSSPRQWPGDEARRGRLDARLDTGTMVTACSCAKLMISL